MKKLFILASLALAFTATAADAPRLGTQERLAALEAKVFGKPSVSPRAPRVDTEATLKAKSDSVARRAAAIAKRDAAKVKPMNPNKPVK